MFVELKTSLSLPDREPTVYDYVASIEGRLCTYGDAGEDVTIGRIRAWKIQLERIEADGEDPWEVLDAEYGELEALYSAIFDVASGAFKPAVLRAAPLDRLPVNIVAIYTVEIDDAYRGRRLGLQLVDRTLEAFGGREDLAALLPHPLGSRGEEGHRIKRASRKLSFYMQSSGFRPIPGSEWLVRNAAGPHHGEPPP